MGLRWNKRFSLTGIWLCMLCAVDIPAVHAADSVSGDALKAAYLYRFPGYVDWPGQPRNSNFTIAVLGGRSVADELERIVSGQTIKARPARVRRINSASEVDDAQVVFIGSDQSPSTVKRTISLLENRPVLIVTDDSRGIAFGGTINFMQAERRIRFEVSLPAAKRSRLLVSSELLAVALRVHEEVGAARAAKETVAQ
jgi:hypothetical protein